MRLKRPFDEALSCILDLICQIWPWSLFISSIKTDITEDGRPLASFTSCEIIICQGVDSLASCWLADGISSASQLSLTRENQKEIVLKTIHILTYKEWLCIFWLFVRYNWKDMRSVLYSAIQMSSSFGRRDMLLCSWWGTNNQRGSLRQFVPNGCNLIVCVSKQ
jgi:hypothetical protein